MKTAHTEITFLLFVFDSLRTIDIKKNPANINFNKEPVQYTENRHRTRRL